MERQAPTEGPDLSAPLPQKLPGPTVHLRACHHVCVSFLPGWELVCIGIRQQIPWWFSNRVALMASEVVRVNTLTGLYNFFGCTLVAARLSNV
jgi:hypothetical protein